MHNYIVQFDIDPRRGVLFQQHWKYFQWKRKGFPAKYMETPYLRQANKRPLFLKDNYSMSAAKRTECAPMFLGQHYLVVEPQAAEFMELLERFYETFRTGSNARSSPSKKSCEHDEIHTSFFLPSISATFKKADPFFFFSFLPLLFASVSLVFILLYGFASVAAVPDT